MQAVSAGVLSESLNEGETVPVSLSRARTDVNAAVTPRLCDGFGQTGRLSVGKRAYEGTRLPVPRRADGRTTLQDAAIPRKSSAAALPWSSRSAEDEVSPLVMRMAPIRLYITSLAFGSRPLTTKDLTAYLESGHPPPGARVRRCIAGELRLSPPW